jgi:hypothetical protein
MHDVLDVALAEEFRRETVAAPWRAAATRGRTATDRALTFACCDAVALC